MLGYDQNVAFDPSETVVWLVFAADAVGLALKAGWEKAEYAEE